MGRVGIFSGRSFHSLGAVPSAQNTVTVLVILCSSALWHVSVLSCRHSPSTPNESGGIQVKVGILEEGASVPVNMDIVVCSIHTRTNTAQ